MPPALTETALIDAMRWRYATKKFDPTRRIPPAQWEAIEEALRLSPSSFGMQPWKFLVINDPATRATIRTLAWNQAQATDASHLVVLAYKRNFGEREIDAFLPLAAKARKLPPESVQAYRAKVVGLLFAANPGRHIDVWTSRQVYLALGVLLASAAAMGIDACPMEGFEPAKVDAALGLEARGLASVVLCALGYRAEDDRYALNPKVRFAREEVVEHI